MSIERPTTSHCTAHDPERCGVPFKMRQIAHQLYWSWHLRGEFTYDESLAFDRLMEWLIGDAKTILIHNDRPCDRCLHSWRYHVGGERCDLVIHGHVCGCQDYRIEVKP